MANQELHEIVFVYLVYFVVPLTKLLRGPADFVWLSLTYLYRWCQLRGFGMSRT
jgi:hypothetical protein